MIEIDVIMPMLGSGIRMQNLQNTCKPLMTLPNGILFFLQALKSLKNFKIRNLILVVLPEFYGKFINLRDEVEKIHKFESYIVIQNKSTENPVDTLKIASEYLLKLKEMDIGVLSLDCDIFGELPELSKHYYYKNVLFYFKNKNPNKSYIIKDKNFVKNIVEKRVISKNAVFGAYLFASNYTLQKVLYKKEMFYISDLVKELLKEYSFYTFEVKNVVNFGTLNEYNNEAKNL